ncbi:heterokaryon incompatibility [Immersiella caudata]|uniref:Heterokaryon incompatibility n=1 Tax=Immersiella caudata TaxID=314043 RepID=A0AA39WEM2_9PEZI|nr:heterokaryon incompatibility [Immersiella caudata]
MEEVQLDFAPQFTALSYAWDSHEGMGQILCDGALLTVTKNCVAALNSIRDGQHSSKSLLWVDAICINQASTREKQQQIAIMGNVYRKAASVRVWLGEEDEASRLVCKYFARISGINSEPRTTWFRSRAREEKPREIGFNSARQWPQLSKSLTDFFSRSWFTRAWPIQEVTLPQPGRVPTLSH